MKRHFLFILCWASCSPVFLNTVFGQSVTEDATAAAKQGTQINPVSIEVARDRAALLHQVFASTLTVMHDRYFHEDQVIIPARAMEDVFSDLQEQAGVEARWIAVSFDPMNINHEVDTDFEKQAAKRIAAGRSHVEGIDDGFYRRATAIPFRTSCISCHAGYFRKPPTKPKFAGLVISIRVAPDAALESSDE